jgi:hypothetical protein
VSAVLELQVITCPLCGGPDATLLCTEHEVGVPGRFPPARCERCGLLYPNPRVRRVLEVGLEVSA